MPWIDSIARLAGRALKNVRAGEEGLAKRVLGVPETIIVRSESFRHEGAIPAELTDSEGESRSPALSWSDPPEGTAELVLLCEDPDIPMRKPFSHWVVYRIPPELRSLPAAIPLGASPSGVVQGKNATRKPGYLGPHPPQGHGPHRYHFQIFALNRPLRVDGVATRDEVVMAMRGHVLACGDLVGVYSR